MRHRRDALVDLGRIGLGAVTLPGLLAAGRAADDPPEPRPKARSCILIFLWGGPPQQDTWDLKPQAASGVRSEFAPIATRVPGLDVCEHLPSVARVADKLAVIRSLTHGSNDHEISIYRSLTGRHDPTVAVPNHARRRSHAPNVAGGVARFSPSGLLPTSVTVPGPVWYSGIPFAGTYAGFLGPQFDPFEVHLTPRPDVRPGETFEPVAGRTAGMLEARRGLLSLIEDRQRRLDSSPGFDELRQRAFDLVSSPAARQAFDLEQEAPRLRQRYGRHVYGESCLLARRLVEAGVRLVTVNWMHFLPDGGTINPWDNHGGLALLGGIGGYEMLVQPYCLPALDQCYSALIEDLAERGLLDETLVVLVGEFGRTPKINAAHGRDHWGMCYSGVLAGGGVRGGQVWGSSDRDAAYPKSQPVSPDDLLATMYWALGIPPRSTVHDPLGRPFPLCDGRPLAALF